MVRPSHENLQLQLIFFSICKIFAQYTPSPGACDDACENTTDCLCRGSTYAILPQNLSTSLKKLTIEISLIQQFSKKDAERYPNLEEFTYLAYGPLKERRSEPKFDTDFFLAFPNLKELFLSRCIATKEQKLVFPNQLQKLILQDMDLADDNLDLGYLSKLNNLVLVDNLLTTIPKLNKTAPLEIIEIYKNPLTSIPTKMLWGFCKLHTLKLHDSKELQTFFKDECECRRFQELVDRQHLIQNGAWKPECRITCSEIATPEMQADYNACMNIVEGDPSKSRLKKIILLAAISLVCLILVIIAIVYCIKKMRLTSTQETPSTLTKVTHSKHAEEEVKRK